MQKDLVDLSKHYIHETERNVLRLEKKKQLHSRSKIVSLQSQRFRGIQMYKINFVLCDLCTRCGPVCLHYTQRVTITSKAVLELKNMDTKGLFW